MGRNSLVAVDVRLEGTLDGQRQVVGLCGCKLGQLGVDVVQVQQGDLLVKNLGENVDANLLLSNFAELDVLLAESLILSLVQGDLGKDLVREGAGHDEGRVACGTAEVDQTTLGEEDNVAAALHGKAVDLRLDVLDRLGVGLQPGNVDLDVEVTNV